MILLILTIIILIIGISLIYWGEKEDGDVRTIIGLIISIFSLLMGIIEITYILIKPYNYKEFKVKYETIRETNTNPNDVRDATFTMKKIEINEEIKLCRVYIDSKWIGIFYNKKICDLELLD